MIKRDVGKLKSESFDILIIGGGITGAGIVRDAAMRGFKAALVEKKDFASGTSSKSSKLAHGGLRYLEQGDFKLVFDACHERKILTHIAPHIVKPIQFIMPIYKGDRRGRFKIRLGMALYDILAGFQNISKHQMLNRDKVLELEPALNPEGLIGGTLFSDCQMNDARLCLENILSAIEKGAVCLNYVEACGFIKENGRARGAYVKDLFSGEKLEVRANVVINATGPWADEVLSLSDANHTRRLRPTKGVHLVVNNFKPNHAILSSTRSDGRMFFILPWGKNSLIGTTDTDYGLDLDRVSVDKTDVDYLLNETDRILTAAKITPESIIAAFAGVRPLLSASGKASSISREHTILESPSGIISVLGGKYTTYRLMAKEVVDRAVKRLKISGIGDCSTHLIPVYGGGQVMGEMREKDDFTLHLIQTYGSRYNEVLDIAKCDERLKMRISPDHPHIAAEVVHAFQNEMAMTLSDFFLRRTWIGYSRSRGKDCINTVADILKRHLNFSEDEIENQVKQYEVKQVVGATFMAPADSGLINQTPTRRKH